MEIVNAQRGAMEGMQALLRMFEGATDGVNAFVQSGVLPRPTLPPTPRPLTEAERAAEQAKLDAIDPLRAKPAARKEAAS